MGVAPPAVRLGGHEGSFTIIKSLVHTQVFTSFAFDTLCEKCPMIFQIVLCCGLDNSSRKAKHNSGDNWKGLET